MAFVQTVYNVPLCVSGSSKTSSIEMAGDWLYMYIIVPTMTSGYGADTQIFIQASADNVNFYRYGNPEVATLLAGTADFAIKSSATQRAIWVPNFAFRYALIETTAVASAGIVSSTAFKFVCVSNQ